MSHSVELGSSVSSTRCNDYTAMTQSSESRCVPRESEVIVKAGEVLYCASCSLH